VLLTAAAAVADATRSLGCSFVFASDQHSLSWSFSGMWRLSAVFLGSLGLILGWAIVSYAQETELDHKRVLTTAVTSWNDYITQSARLQGTVVSILSEVANPGRNVKETCHYYHTDDSALVQESSFGPGREDHRVNCVNDRYSFELARSSASRPWALKALDVKAHVRSSDPKDPRLAIDLFLQSPLSIVLPLDQLPILVQDPDFKITGLAHVDAGGEGLVKIDFRGRAKDLNDKTDGVLTSGRLSLESGWFTLDPGRFWLIREYSVRSRSAPNVAITIHGTHQYGELRAGFPVLKKIVRRYHHFEPKLPETEQTCEFEISNRSLPDTSFTLSAFDLPEPVATTHKTQRRYVWFLGAATVCAVMAALIRYRARRRLGVSMSQ
jgi:hypothetical protein